MAAILTPDWSKANIFAVTCTYLVDPLNREQNATNFIDGTPYLEAVSDQLQ